MSETENTYYDPEYHTSLITINITILEKYSLSLRILQLGLPFGIVFQLWETIPSKKEYFAGIFGVTPFFNIIWAKMDNVK